MDVSGIRPHCLGLPHGTEQALRLGRLDDVGHQHCPGHLAHAAWDRGDVPGHLEDPRGDIPDQSLVGAGEADVPHGGTIILNTDEFIKRNLTKVGYATDPLDDDTLTPYQVHRVAMSTLTQGALADTGLGKKDAERCKNMFALGLLSWMYHRPTEGTERFLREKFAKRPDLAEANVLAFKAGHAYGETTESFAVTYEVAPAPLPPGTQRITVFSAGVAAGAKDPNGANALIAYLRSPAAAGVIRRAGLEPFLR